MNIPVYVVNLPTSLERKEYMQNLLSAYPFMETEFIPAINGRQMTEEQRRDAFDYDASMKRYGRILNEGEVGCTLSHRLCCKYLLDSENAFALVLEDDVSVIRDWTSLPWEAISETLNVSQPRVLFLSGDYWRLSSKSITKVFDAVGTYAYMLNRAAAQSMLSIPKPFVVADDWRVYKRLGVKLFAVHPYAADANLVESLSSDIKQESWTTNHTVMSKRELLKRAFPALAKKVLRGLGLFESKFRG